MKNYMKLNAISIIIFILIYMYFNAIITRKYILLKKEYKIECEEKIKYCKKYNNLLQEKNNEKK